MKRPFYLHDDFPQEHWDPLVLCCCSSGGSAGAQGEQVSSWSCWSWWVFLITTWMCETGFCCSGDKATRRGWGVKGSSSVENDSCLFTGPHLTMGPSCKPVNHLLDSTWTHRHAVQHSVYYLQEIKLHFSSCWKSSGCCFTLDQHVSKCWSFTTLLLVAG